LGRSLGKLPEELLHSGRKSLKWASLHLAVLASGSVNLVAARGHCHIHHGGSDSRRDSLHGMIERSESGYAVIVDCGRGVNIAVADEEHRTQCEGCGNRCGKGQSSCRCY